MNGGPQPPPRRRPRPYDTSPRPARNVFDYLPVISLLIFLIAVGGIMIAVSAWLSPAGDPVAVPGFMGMQFEQASKEADRAHLRLHVIARRPDFHAAKDVVVGQLPAAGEKVRSGRTIDIILSAGTPMMKTPNLSNLSLRDAQLALENARLELGSVQEQNNTDVIAGQVLEQHPDPFSEIKAGSKVNVVVAKGRPLLYTPSFLGLSIDFVKQAAKEARIEIGLIRYLAITPGAKPKGVVVQQDPPPGLVLAPKQRVALQLSGGAPATPTPSPSPSPPESAAPQPSATVSLPSPVSQRLLRVSVALPRSDKPQPVRVVLEDASGSRTLYADNTTGGVTLSFDVSVTGAATIQTYVGDTLISTTPF